MGACAGPDRFRIDDIELLYEEQFVEPTPDGFRTLHVHNLLNRDTDSRAIATPVNATAPVTPEVSLP